MQFKPQQANNLSSQQPAFQPIPLKNGLFFFPLLLMVGLFGCLEQPSSRKGTRLTLKPLSAANAEALEETRQVLMRRLKANGFADVNIQRNKEGLALTLPPMSATRLKQLQQTTLTQQGLTTLVPVVNKSEALPKIATFVSKDAMASSLGIKAASDSWTGDKGVTFVTQRIQAPDKLILMRYLRGLAIRRDAPQLAGHERWVYVQQKDLWSAYLVDHEAGIQLSRFVDVKKTSKTDLSLHLHADDTKRFHSFTKRHVGKKVFLRVDGTVYASPVVRAAIRGSVIRLSLQSRHNTPMLLKSLLAGGALPIMLKVTPSR